MNFSSQFRRYGMGPLSIKTLWVGAGKAVQFLAWLLTLAVLVRRLDRHAFGVFQQGWLLVSTLTPILLLGLPQGINYLLSRGSSEERRQSVWLGVLLTSALAGIVGLVFIFHPQMAGWIVGEQSIVPLISVLVLVIWSNLPGNFLEPLAIFREQQKALLWIQTLYWTAFGAVAILLGARGNLLHVFAGLAVVGLARSAVTLAFVFRHFGGWQRNTNAATWRAIGSMALFLGPVAVVDVLSVQIDKYVVSQRFGANGFAIYSLGSIEVPFIPLLLAAVTSTLMPELSLLLSTGSRDEALSLLRRSMEKLGYLILPLFFYLLLFGRLWIPLAFGVRYQGVIPVFIVFLFLVPLRSLNLHPIFIGGGLQKYLLRGRVLDVGLNFAGSIMLAGTSLGLLGPAVAAVGATVVHKIYQTAVLQREFKQPLRQVYPWDAFAKTSAWSAVGAVLAYGLANIAFAQEITQAIAGSILFGAWMLFWWRRSLA